MHVHYLAQQMAHQPAQQSAQQPAKRLRRFVTIDDPISVKRNKKLPIKKFIENQSNPTDQANGKTRNNLFNFHTLKIKRFFLLFRL